MATSEWLQFFEDAGIPPGPALGYAVAFVDNRIHKNMLLDLTKELMKELGITVVGDIIAILRHAKVVHRQEMCRAASESLQPSEGGRAIDRDRSRDQIRDQSRDPPRDQTRDHHRDHHRDLSGAAGRMITNSLSRDPAPRSSRKPPGAGISVTVANGAAEAAVPEAPSVPSKRRRVTAEMEGKYVITLPKGTTARSRKILQLQAARGLSRPSVFERLGAEAKAAAAGKPSGVFSRLGEALAGADPGADPGAADAGDAGPDAEALPYAGVLKKRRECSGSSGAAAAAALACGEAQDGAVSSSVPWGCGRVSSSSSSSSSSSCGAGSVFRRLGRKPD